MRLFFALLVPVVALSLGSVACSGADPEPISNDPETNEVQSGLADEGHECSAQHKCKAGLVCVARVRGGDVGIKGVPCADCGQTSSSSSSGSTSSSSGDWGSTSSSSGWSSSSGSTTSSGWGGSTTSSGWSSSSSSSGWSSSSSSSGWSSSSGATPEVGVCITIH
ncbi:MAG: hypothetical protein U0270_25465 [Labilithrix sp.]